MLILNFSHPFTETHLAQIKELVNGQIIEIREVKTEVEANLPLGPQVIDLVESIGLKPEDWQTQPLMVNPPALNFVAVTLLAELHGRMGYFPPCLRLRPTPNCLPPKYDVAEVINLQEVRNQARIHR